MDKKIHDFINL